MITKTGLDIAQRRTPYGEQGVHVFGSNSLVGTTSETVWNYGGLYPWAAFDLPQIIYLVSTSVEDTGTILIRGLDSEYLEIEESVSITGTTPAVSTLEFKRINRIRYTNHATTAGTVTAHVTSAAGVVVAQIDPGKNCSLSATYTTPSNARGYLAAYTAGTAKVKESFIDLYVRDRDGLFHIRSEVEVNNMTFTQNFSVPLLISPASDIDFRSVVASGDGSVIVNFDLILDY